MGIVADVHRRTGGEAVSGTGDAVFILAVKSGGVLISEKVREESTAVDVALIAKALTRITARGGSTLATTSERIGTGACTRAMPIRVCIRAYARTIHNVAKHARVTSHSARTHARTTYAHRVKEVTKFIPIVRTHRITMAFMAAARLKRNRTDGNVVVPKTLSRTTRLPTHFIILLV
jgi:hypothetical protein